MGDLLMLQIQQNDSTCAKAITFVADHSTQCSSRSATAPCCSQRPAR